jgi:hypothetical protein
MRAFPVALASLMLLAASDAVVAAPAIELSPRVITEGQSVSLRASGFTPNGHILAHLARPDGTEYPEMSFTADARGEVSHLITIILILTGTYEVQMIDLASKAVAVSRFMVVEGTLPAVSGSPSDRMAPSRAGTWHGPVVRAGSPQAQTVLMSLSGGGIGGAVGTVAYPSAGCGGELWLLGVSGDSVQLGEHITYGEDRCRDGVVTARPSKDGSLEIQRRDAAHVDGVPASGTLPRRQ